MIVFSSQNQRLVNEDQNRQLHRIRTRDRRLIGVYARRLQRLNLNTNSSSSSAEGGDNEGEED